MGENMKGPENLEGKKYNMKIVKLWWPEKIERGERKAKLQLAKLVNGTQNFGDKVQSMVNYHPFQ